MRISNGSVTCVPITPTDRPDEPEAMEFASRTVTCASRSIRLTAVDMPSVLAPMTTTWGLKALSSLRQKGRGRAPCRGSGARGDRRQGVLQLDQYRRVLLAAE
jgi:hypothetical protein